MASCESADLSFADLPQLRSERLLVHRCRLHGACLDGAQLSGMLAANLDGRGLRAVGANLLDLRGALLDPEQRVWLQKCRAILDPVPVAEG